MNELNWRIFKFTIVLTSIGLFFAALYILDACIRCYWVRKQQLPRYYRTEEILNIRNLVKVDKLFDIERENHFDVSFDLSYTITHLNPQSENSKISRQIKVV